MEFEEEVFNALYPFAEGWYELVPEGWRYMFIQLCGDLTAHLMERNKLYDLHFLDVKEKWGALRIETDYIDIPIDLILRKYGYISQFIDPISGRPDSTFPGGFNMYGAETRYIDCADEWNRIFEL